MRYRGFVGPAYRSQSMIAAPDRLVNWYPERIETGGKASMVYYPTPGLRSHVAAPQSGGGRGLFAQAGRAFEVIGNGLYEIVDGAGIVARGNVDQDQYPASMVTNGDGGAELFIVSGDVGYVLNLQTNVLTQEVLNVTMGDMLDGYFLALDIASSTLKISDLLDGTTWDPTQIAQRTSAPDPWRSMIVANQRIWLLGDETSEVWYNAGTSPFPFAPVQGLVIPYGIAAPFSIKQVGTRLIWLARTANGQGVVVEAQGYDPVRISTHALEYAISQYGRIDDAKAWTYQDQGHEFYVLTFPSGSTWVYDTTMGLWHERAAWDAEMALYRPWGPQHHCFAFGKHLVLDALTGGLFEMRTDVYTDVSGAVIRRERIPPGLFNEHKTVFVDRFELHLETGVALVSGQGSDPTVMLSWSKDGGKTFGAEHWRSAGALGQYSTRVQWTRQGSGDDLVPKLVCTDPVPWRVIDAYVTVRQGAA